MNGLSVAGNRLEQILHGEGLTLSGVLGRESFARALEPGVRALASWQAAGRAGDMAYMCRDEAIYRDLEAILPGAESIIMVLAPYAPGGPDERAACAPGTGRVARYAWGRDYHRVLRKKLERVVDVLRAQLPAPAALAFRARCFADAVPILERTLGASMDLGFVGRNSMLIRPGVGSYTFLAEIVSNLSITGIDSEGTEVRALDRQLAPGSGCGTCCRCIPACPTEAIVADGIIDARLCISYLTIEKRGKLTRWERAAIGDWIFGCDICQEVCPFNHRGATAESLPEFSPERGAGGGIELNTILMIRDEDTFARRYGGTALTRAGREQLLRNGAAVATNQRSMAAVPALLDAAESDPSPLVRSEAAAALSDFAPYLEGKLRDDVIDCLSRSEVVRTGKR